MWLFAQIFAYLVVAFAIGAVGAWVLRGRMAEDSLEHLRQRFRQMVRSSEMERDAARLRVRELSRMVEELEARLEGRTADGWSTADAGSQQLDGSAEGPGSGRTMGPPEPPAGEAAKGESAAAVTAAPDVREGRSGDGPPEAVERTIASPSEFGSVTLGMPAEEESEAPDGSSWGAPERAPQGAPGGAPVDPEPDRPEESVVGVETLAPPAAEPAANGSPGAVPVARPAEGGASPEPRAPGASHGDAPPEPTEAGNGRRTRADPGPGGGHPLSHLGEVPPEVSNRLRSMGIHDTSALHRHFRGGTDPSALARTLDVEPRRVRRWRVLAELLEVPDLSPENAWLLEISGVTSFTELAEEDPGELADRMAGLNEDQGLGLPAPNQDRVASWVLWASQAG